MPLGNLNEDEKVVVFECLKCVASGKVILHDWEFPTIMGIELQELLAVVNKWPDVDDSQEAVFLAINNSMNNLLGYPHGRHSTWDEYIPVPQAEIARVFGKWRDTPISDYVDGLR
ncbi:MAG: hypothetical protein LLH30_15240 [Candidatus Manganitrophus sp. SA1]|nr:hypothetical protein [Candidatus Manganitrophus morganii]